MTMRTGISRRQALAATLALGSMAPFGALGALGAAAPPLPRPAHGRIERLEGLPWRHLPARPVDVWLPEGHDPARRCQVLYVHDGQMQFDATQTWNGQAWRLDAALTRLMRAGRIADTLVVAVWNRPEQRYAEYLPEAFLARAPAPLRRAYAEDAAPGGWLSEAYLRFLVEELKPAIDARYATRPGREHTFVMGASMGGLISWHALLSYPEVFGGAAGLSTHWVGVPTRWGAERLRNAALPLAALGTLAERLPAPGRHRLYSDRGDDALDALYAPAHAMLADLLHERGWRDDAMLRVFPGTGHRESDWAARVELPLLHLLAPPR